MIKEQLHRYVLTAPETKVTSARSMLSKTVELFMMTVGMDLQLRMQ